MLEGFLARFPRDDIAPMARISLALVALGQADFGSADAQLKLTSGLPAGSARDLWTIARAKALRLHSDPEAALALLRPLVGKNVDPMGRWIFEEELTLAALSTHRDYEAISYMDAWLRASSDEDKTSTVERVTQIVAQLPKDVLVGAFEALRTQRSTFGYGIEIERILWGRLVEIATTSGDATLARLLLDSDPDAIVARAGEAHTALGELANSRRGLNVVAGRTVGLLLPSESPGLRDESADVLRGVMWALGLPRGARSAAARPKVGERNEPGPIACAPPEAAPDAGEPGPDDAIRLVTRDDTGSAARTELSLDELAGEGAAVVIAGLDGQTATRALRWGRSHALAVVVLASPDEPLEPSPFGFVLGEPRANVLDVLSRAVPALDLQPVTPIVDWSEMSLYPANGGRLWGLTVTPPVLCDVAAARAGDPRFPYSASDGGKAIAWLVSGSPSCATDAVAELTTERARGVVALTLEAAAVPHHAAGLRVVTAQAGVIPEVAPGDPREEEVQRFSATLGPVGWWTALGRDASAFARLAVRILPTNEVSDPSSVEARRASARDTLASARLRLWTSEASGWPEQHAMKRTVCALEAPAR